MGTPAFAVPCLNALIEQHKNIVAVVTQPDKELQGRGKKNIAQPVKIEAQRHGFPLLQPENINIDPFIRQLKSLSPDLFVVVAYGKILSQEVLSIPKLGAINVHASLLPQYRGAAPIQWAIINGEKETGVTTMVMDAGMDTGNILLSSRVPIEPEDTAETLHDRMAEAGAKVLLATIDSLKNGALSPTPQNHSMATYAPILKKKDGWIDWKKSAVELNCFIRGMYPWPGAHTTLYNKKLKILKARAESLENHTVDAGAVIPSFPGELLISTGQGALYLEKVQLESGKALNIEEFLRGHTVTPGTKLGKSHENNSAINTIC
ncbi:MAG: methionyl-tRNA formyltransferase [Pseudomonadota bacterium]